MTTSKETKPKPEPKPPANPEFASRMFTEMRKRVADATDWSKANAGDIIGAHFMKPE